MLQLKYLLVGLLLAAAFVGYQWLDDQPAIPPVRLPVSAVEHDDAAKKLEAQPGPYEMLTDDGGDDLTVEEPLVDPLPALNDSDDWLRQRLADTTLPWLAETELVRTSATVLENAARGEVPRKFLEFLAPEGSFSVTNDRGRLAVAPASHARYDSFVATLTFLPPDRAAQTFDLIEPLLFEALRELGGDSTGKVATPRELAHTALAVVLATPTGAVDATLVRPKVIYKYADESFEKLLPLQKQLLRMGPDNLQKVRGWLEEFGAALAPWQAPLVSSDG